MATFDEINQQGKVLVTEIIIPDKDKEYRFEYMRYDSDIGALLPEKVVEQFNEQYFISERAGLIAQRDAEIKRCDTEIAEIDAKMIVIAKIKKKW